MCPWHFLSSILQEHTRASLHLLSTRFQDTDRKHPPILLPQTSAFNKVGSVVSLHLQEHTCVLTVRYRWLNPHSTLPKEPQSVSHRPQRWEKPQRRGLAGSAQFCHRCFRLYCPVPWHHIVQTGNLPQGWHNSRESQNILTEEHFY